MRRDITKQRMGQMLNADKEEMNEGTKNAAIASFSHVAREYFDVNGEVNFELKRTKNDFEVSICFRADRVKNFTVLK